MLGWSEEGARIYSEELLEKNYFPNIFSGNEFLIAIAVTIFSILAISVYFIMKYKKERSIIFNTYQDYTESSKEAVVESSKEAVVESSKEAVVIVTSDIEINTKIDRSKQEYNLVYDLLIIFQATKVDTDLILRHILLLFLLLIEFIQDLPNLISLKTEDLDGRLISNSVNSFSNESENIKFDERKNILMKKKNIELKRLLRGVPKISRLNKNQLVNKVLMMEFRKYYPDSV